MKRSMVKYMTLLVLLHVAAGCRGPGFNLPPEDRLAQPGPGVGGPGPGVLSPEEMMGIRNVGGTGPVGHPDEFEVDGLAAGAAAGACFVGPSPTVQVLFRKPGGMQVTWDSSGSGQFDSMPLVVPGRTNFQQAGLYRLKLTNVPGHEGIELYPTIEIGQATPRTHPYLAHNAVPFQLTADDLNQVTSGNFVTKVIYLPYREFQHLAVPGVETLVSTRLDPGEDPIVKASSQGSILAIIRIGNKDIEMPGLDGESTLEYTSITGNGGSVQTVGYDHVVGDGGGYVGEGFDGEYCAGGGPQPTAIPPAGLSAYGPPMSAMSHLTGVTSPPYGMPITGTPIGLPGPPHIPLGAPAGLRKHSMRNWTHNYMPHPSHKIHINVKQSPPIRYPEPRTHAWIHQYNHPNCAHCLGAGCANCQGKCAHCQGAGCAKCRTTCANCQGAGCQYCR